MSVRGYKVIKFEYQKTPSFNLWHDDDLMALFDNYTNYASQLNMDGSGTFEVTAGQIRQVIAKAKEQNLDDADRLEQLESDVKGLKDHEWVQYTCF